MTKLNFEVSEEGLGRTRAKITSVAEANSAGKLFAGISLGLSFVDGQARQVADPNAEGRAVQPLIWVPRDEEVAAFEQMQLGVADPVDPLDVKNIPQWLIDALRLAHPRHFVWENIDALEGGIKEAAWTVLSEYRFLDHAGFVESGRVLVSEPYALNQDQLGSLFEFITDGDLHIRFVGLSNYYPSRTLRIEIWKA